MAVGVAYAEFRSWGFSNAEIGLLTLVTGAWNALIKFGMPVVALAILAVRGHAGRGLLTASLVGLAAMAVSVALVGLALWNERWAARVGSGLGRLVSLVGRPFGMSRRSGWDKQAVAFRRQLLKLAKRRWPALTLTTIVSHVALFLVLLTAVRDVGIPAAAVTWDEALGVFAFARLASALPITPGGVGVVELSYVGGLVLAGGPRPEVVAAVLLFRALTYFLQIPLGLVAYAIWQHKKDWRRQEAGPAQPPRARSRVKT